MKKVLLLFFNDVINTCRSEIQNFNDYKTSTPFNGQHPVRNGQHPSLEIIAGDLGQDKTC